MTHTFIGSICVMLKCEDNSVPSISFSYLSVFLTLCSKIVPSYLSSSSLCSQHTRLTDYILSPGAESTGKPSETTWLNGKPVGFKINWCPDSASDVKKEVLLNSLGSCWEINSGLPPKKAVPLCKLSL